VGAVVLAVLIGYARDAMMGEGFPSGTTVAIAVAAFVGIELHAMFRGARALSISDSGLTVERSFGGKALRLAWNEIKHAEARGSLGGLVWTFHAKDGREVRWSQLDFDGNQRAELEKALRDALGKHGVRLF
jgi:hypothetical protein